MLHLSTNSKHVKQIMLLLLLLLLLMLVIIREWCSATHIKSTTSKWIIILGIVLLGWEAASTKISKTTSSKCIIRVLLLLLEGLFLETCLVGGCVLLLLSTALYVHALKGICDFIHIWFLLLYWRYNWLIVKRGFLDFLCSISNFCVS